MWGQKDVRYNTLVWMALAFCASLGLAISIVAVFGIKPGFSLALRATARWAFLLYLPAYVGGPLTSLFGSAFLPVRQRAREFGLAFASAMIVHLGIVVCLCAIGAAPPAKTFVKFGIAAIFTYLLALFSIRRGARVAAPEILAVFSFCRDKLYRACVYLRLQELPAGRCPRRHRLPPVLGPCDRRSDLESRRLGANSDLRDQKNAFP